MNRNEKTEVCFQNCMRKVLTDMLLLLNPQDQMVWGAMRYKELAIYASDFLLTEIEQITRKEEPASIESPAALAL